MNAPPASLAEATAVGAPGARPLPDHGALLLAALADPASTALLSEDRWDLLLRTARQAKLLALLAHRLAGAGVRQEFACVASPKTFENENVSVFFVCLCDVRNVFW